MGFSQKIKEDALVAAARHCCVCHKRKGLNIEVHHITPRAQGGKDTLANAIALCPDCHADAGHYFAGHPRGTKLSPPELIKHREAWYKIVNDNNIDDTCIGDCLHFRHIIFETDILELLKGSFSNSIIPNPLFFPNQIGRFMKKHLENIQIPVDILSEYIGYKDYIQKYPHAEKNKFGADNIPFQRTPTNEEIAIISQNNLFIKYLSENNVDNDQICQILAYDINHGCGDNSEYISTPLCEKLYERNYYLQTLVITNITDKPIQIKQLHCNSTEFILHKRIRESEQTILKLPNTPILPNQNVIIPTAIICDYNLFNFIKEIKTYCLGDWYDMISQVSSSNIEYIGEVLEPVKMTYQFGSNLKEDVIHTIDYNSLYLINGSALCGSCPHLFFENDKHELSYGGELFSAMPNSVFTEQVRVPDNTVAIVIAELEQEVTFINNIVMNNRVLNINKQLQTGDYHRFTLTEKCSELFIKGKYTLMTNNYTILEPFEKYRIITSFINNWSNKNYDQTTKTI